MQTDTERAYEADEALREICLIFGFDPSDGEGTSCAEVVKLVSNHVLSSNRVNEMIARYLVASKGRVSDSWLQGFVECGAVTIDTNYPTTLIVPVKQLPHK